MIRVVVVDDQAAVREGLVVMLDLLDDVRVVGEAGDGAEALTVVAETGPDVVLMDLRMPRLDGVAATERIHADHPSVRVVVLTTYAEDEHILSALRAGALGYLTKDAGRVQIAQAVRSAASGQSVLSAEVQQKLLAAAAGGTGTGGGTGAGGGVGAAGSSGGAGSSVGSVLPDGLTAREVEVLRLIAAGLNNRQIAGRLFVTEATVKSHINRLFAKAGLSHRAQAVQYAYRHGLAPLS